jgi:N-sulfoglucosamine sulfohydrolase
MRSLTLLALLVIATPAAAQVKKPDPRPNILIIIADDWGWPHAGAYGDKVVKTPNFDRVAKQGMLFHRAYCVAPSCTPSRAALLTGQWVHRLQEGGNLWGILPNRYAVYPDLLENAGYAVGLFGKGWGPGTLEGSGRTRNPAGPLNKGGFAAFLKDLPADRPFCFWYGSTDPHRPYDLGSGAKAGLNAKNVKVPPVWPDNATVRSDILDYYLEVQRFDDQVGELLRLLEQSGRTENTIVIIMSDNGMPFPRAKANLYDMGTHLPLAIRWPARMPKKGGQESQAFVSWTDLAPTILEAAGVKVPADMNGTSLVPLLTTGKDTVARDKVFVERERHANVRKGDLSYPSRAIRTRDYLYIVNFRPDRWPAGDPETYFAVGPFGDIDGSPTKEEVLKTRDSPKEDHKCFDLCCDKRPPEELYDLKKDPDEMINVADEGSYAKIKTQLREELAKWMKSTGDPRLGLGGGDDRWDQFKYFGGPVKMKKKEKGKQTSGLTLPTLPPLRSTARSGDFQRPAFRSAEPENEGATTKRRSRSNLNQE